MATYYKAKVGSLAGLEKHEIIHFGYMDTDSDGVVGYDSIRKHLAV